MGNFTSAIDICNDAIARIGGKFISSIETPRTHTETLIASMYTKNRKIILRSAVWNFAKKYTSIAKTTEVLTGFSAVYNLPNDFVRFLGIDNLNISPSDTDRYMLADGKIYLRDASVDSIVLIYIRDIEEVAKYDALFVEVFSLRLAYNLSYSLSGKNTLSDRLLKEYQDALTDAKMIDGQEQRPIRIQRSKWMQKRRRGNTSQYAGPYRCFED